MSTKSSGTLIRIGVSSNGKQFFDKYTVPVDVKNNITIKVKNNRSSSKKVYSYIVRMRKLS